MSAARPRRPVLAPPSEGLGLWPREGVGEAGLPWGCSICVATRPFASGISQLHAAPVCTPGVRQGAAGQTRPARVMCARCPARGGTGPCFHTDFTPFLLPTHAVCVPVSALAGNAAHPSPGGEKRSRGPPTARAGLGRVCSTPCQMLMSAGGTALEQQSPRETLGEPRFPPAALRTRLQGWQPSEYPGRFALPGCTLPRSQGGTEQHDVQCWQPLACLSGVICWSSGSLIGRKDWGCKSPSVAAVASKITSSLMNGESSLLRRYSPLDSCMWSAATHSWGAHVAEGTRKPLAGGSRGGFPSAGGPGWCFLKPLFDLGPALQVLHNFRLSRLWGGGGEQCWQTAGRDPLGHGAVGGQ